MANSTADGTQRRVVVTGLGATTPLAGDLPGTWSAALEGRSGARPIEADWLGQYELSVTFAAQLAVPTADTLTKVETRRLDPSGQMAMVAAREAWRDAGSPAVEPERLGRVGAPARGAGPGGGRATDGPGRLGEVGASGSGGACPLWPSCDVLKEKGAA